MMARLKVSLDNSWLNETRIAEPGSCIRKVDWHPNRNTNAAYQVGSAYNTKERTDTMDGHLNLGKSRSIDKLLNFPKLGNSCRYIIRLSKRTCVQGFQKKSDKTVKIRSINSGNRGERSETSAYSGWHTWLCSMQSTMTTGEGTCS